MPEQSLSAHPAGRGTGDRLRRDPARRARRRGDRLHAGRSPVRRRLLACRRASGCWSAPCCARAGWRSSPCSRCGRWANGARSPTASGPGMPPADGPTTDEPIALRDLAGSLARDAGRVAYAGRRAARRRRRARATTTKSTGTDIVTEFDRAAEAEIVATARHATRRRDRRRGGHGRQRHERLRLVHRPDRRHHQLRLRPADVVVLGRRRRTTARCSPAPCTCRRSTRCSTPRSAHGATLNGDPIAASAETDLGTGAGRHRLQLPPRARAAPRPSGWPR